MDKPTIIILSKRWKHHTSSGGYDKLIDDLNSINISPSVSEKYLFSLSVRKRVLKKIIPSVQYLNGYNLNDMAAEFSCFRTARKTDKSVLHALYGEDQLLFLLKFRKHLKSALVATYHLPAESPFMKRVLKTDYYNRLKALDAAIVVSRSLISDYQNWVGKENVFFVPHGIDCDVFKPAQTKKENQTNYLNIITVGGHGRDWDTLHEVIKNFIRNLNIKFTIVGPAKSADMFSKYPNVNFLTGIEEYKLIELYQKADVAFIPVTYATANNSLLESLACGTPVISTNTGGIPDYLDEKCGWLLPPRNSDDAVKLIESLLRDENHLRDKEGGARKKAIEFDWPMIANKMSEVYKHAYGNFQKNR